MIEAGTEYEVLDGTLVITRKNWLTGENFTQKVDPDGMTAAYAFFTVAIIFGMIVGMSVA